MLDHKNIPEIKELAPNGDGTYCVVFHAKTPDGYIIKIGIPSADIPDIHPFEDLIVDNIPWMEMAQDEMLMKYEVLDE